jgi:hypothetical protein
VKLQHGYVYVIFPREPTWKWFNRLQRCKNDWTYLDICPKNCWGHESTTCVMEFLQLPLGAVQWLSWKALKCLKKSLKHQSMETWSAHWVVSWEFVAKRLEVLAVPPKKQLGRWTAPFSIAKNAESNVLLVKIEGPVWYTIIYSTIYHHGWT